MYLESTQPRNGGALSPLLPAPCCSWCPGRSLEPSALYWTEEPPRDLSAQPGRQRCCQQISFSQSASQRLSFPRLSFRRPYSHLIPLLVYQGWQRKVAQTGYWFSNSSGVWKSEVKVSPGLGPPSLSCSWSYSPRLHMVFLWSVCLYPFLLFIKGYMPFWIRSQPNDLMLI